MKHRGSLLEGLVHKQQEGKTISDNWWKIRGWGERSINTEYENFQTKNDTLTTLGEKKAISKFSCASVSKQVYM